MSAANHSGRNPEIPHGSPRACPQRASACDEAGGVVQRHLGFLEEDEGDKTQPEPDPHRDPLAEMAEKLDGLAAETEDDTAATHITNARDDLEAAVHERE